MFSSRVPIGEMLFGLFILGAFIYGTIEMSRSGARAVQFNGLRERVLKHVSAHPETKSFTLADLQQAGVLNAEDVDFLSSNDITYHPIGADSPKDALCFVQRRTTEETRYYRDGRTDYLRNWTSPNEEYTVVSAPKPDLPKERTIAIVEQATGKVLGEFDAKDASASETFWSADSRFAAITTHRHTSAPFVHYMDCRFLFEMTPQGVRSIEVPSELRPDHLIAPKHAGKEIRWSNHWVMAKGWRGHELIVESQGQGRIAGNGAEPELWLNIIYRFEVHVADGKAAIAKRSQKHYAEVPSKS